MNKWREIKEEGNHCFLWLCKAMYISYFPTFRRKHFSVSQQPNLGQAPSLSVFVETQIRDTHTYGRASLDKGSACRCCRYLHNAKQSQETKIHTLSGTRTDHPSNQAAADLHFGRHCRQDWLHRKLLSLKDPCLST